MRHARAPSAAILWLGGQASSETRCDQADCSVDDPQGRGRANVEGGTGGGGGGAGFAEEEAGARWARQVCALRQSPRTARGTSDHLNRGTRQQPLSAPPSTRPTSPRVCGKGGGSASASVFLQQPLQTSKLRNSLSLPSPLHTADSLAHGAELPPAAHVREREKEEKQEAHPHIANYALTPIAALLPSGKHLATDTTARR